MTDDAAAGLLIALGRRFLDAGKLDHAAWTLERAVATIEAGGYASQRDTMLLHEHLARLERRRRHS